MWLIVDYYKNPRNTVNTGFERARKIVCAPVAQWIEQRFPEPCVIFLEVL